MFVAGAFAALALGARPAAASTFYFSSNNASGEPQITLEGKDGATLRIVSKALAGGTLHWFTVWKERIQHAWTQVERLEGFEEDLSGKGEIEIQLDHAPPRLSLWAFVLPESDAVVVWTPPGYPLRLLATELDTTLGKLRSGRDRLEIPGKRIEWTLFRPKVGVWRGKSYDGTDLDEDGLPNGRTRLGLASLHAAEKALEKRPDLDPGPPPEVLMPGDLLIAFDVRTMRFLVARVKP